MVDGVWHVERRGVLRVSGAGTTTVSADAVDPAELFRLTTFPRLNLGDVRDELLAEHVNRSFSSCASSTDRAQRRTHRPGGWPSEESFLTDSGKTSISCSSSPGTMAERCRRRQRRKMARVRRITVGGKRKQVSVLPP